MSFDATKLADDVAADSGIAQSPVSPATARFTYASGSRPLAGYTIKRGIGHGGFGEVYYATSDAGKEVALKLIRRNLDVELRGVTQCLNLKHPNLLALYDVRQDEAGDTWVVMELMVGQSLEEVLARSPQGMPVEEALAWMHGIAAGVAYLHDHGIVHRDLKPGNLFVDEGIVKIGDYGLSKFISCSRRSGQTGSVGTVHYMAPEIANGRYGKEIDIYALGVMFFEMLTGHVPFEGESVGEILMKHLTAEADCSPLAEPYRTIVSRCLAKDPAKRFHSVSELIAMLPAAPKHSAAHFVGASPVLQTGSREATSHQKSTESTRFSLSPEIVQSPPQASGGPINESRSSEDFQRPLESEVQVNPIKWIEQMEKLVTHWWPTSSAGPISAWWLIPILSPTVLLALMSANVRGAASDDMASAAFLTGLLTSFAAWYVLRKGWRRATVILTLYSLGCSIGLIAYAILEFPKQSRRNDPDGWLVMFPFGVITAVLGVIVIYLTFRIARSQRYNKTASAESPNTVEGAPHVEQTSIGHVSPTGTPSAAWILGLMFRWFILGTVGMGVLRFVMVGSDRWIGEIVDSRGWQLLVFIGIVSACFGSLLHQWRQLSPNLPSGSTTGMAKGERFGEPATAMGISQSPTRRRWHEQSTYNPGTPRDRATQLIGAMLLSAVVCLVLALVMLILRGQTPEPTQYAWLAMSAIVGSWAVLVPAKLWEGNKGDAALRRFAMLVIGLGLGVAVYGITEWLMVAMPYEARWQTGPGGQLQRSFYEADGSPRLVAFLAYFGFVFAVLRWWRLADPTRPTRLSVWHTAVGVLGAIVMGWFWPFPQPWGWMLIATIAIAVQLASPCAMKSSRSSSTRYAGG